MSDESLRELRRKHNEERKDEMSSLINFMMGLAKRDCFPSDKLIRIMDKNSRVQEYQFEFANPWYVSEPVSTVQNASVILDGETIGSEHLALVIREQKIPIEVARTFHELWWGFAEIARISINPAAIQEIVAGSLVDMELHFDMRTTMNYGVKDNLAQYVLSKKLEVE